MARLAAGVLLLVLATGCGGSEGSGARDVAAASSSTAVTTYGGVPGAAQRVGCSEDVRQLQQLSDLYVATHGRPAPSLQTFVDDGSIDHLPADDHGYVIGYDAATGKVSATGACTVA